jgi:hypothetical protein
MIAACIPDPVDGPRPAGSPLFAGKADVLIQADYQRCVTVRPGPIERPDGYTAHPYERKKDDA